MIIIYCVKNHLVLGKKRSMVSAIVDFLHKIYSNLSNGYDSNIIYLDLKKTFNNVDHNMLIHKLKLVGLDNDTVKDR